MMLTTVQNLLALQKQQVESLGLTKDTLRHVLNEMAHEPDDLALLVDEIGEEAEIVIAAFVGHDEARDARATARKWAESRVTRYV